MLIVLIVVVAAGAWTPAAPRQADVGVTAAVVTWMAAVRVEVRVCDYVLAFGFGANSLAGRDGLLFAADAGPFHAEVRQLDEPPPSRRRQGCRNA